MRTPNPAPPTWNGSIADGRLVNRLAVALVLDLVATARGDRRLLDTLLIAAVVAANVAAISRQADLQVAFADLAHAPPDSARRPVSINAVATSLRLPFETVRRRLHALAKAGICRFVEGGVIVPAEALTSEEYLRNGFLAYERLRRFYYHLRDLDLLPPLPRPTVGFAPDQAPVRAVARLTSDYVLRVVDTVLETVGDLAQGVVLLEIFRCNVEHLPDEMRGGEGVTPADFPEDRLRRPTRLGAVAARVGLPVETVRRHAKRLEAAGYLRRLNAGLLVSGEALARPALLAFMAGNLANLQRMLAGLSQLGVLAIWDELNPGSLAPAKIPQNG